MSNSVPEGWHETTIGKITSTNSLFSDGDWVESKDQDPRGNNRLIQLADIGDGVFINKSSRFMNDEQFERLNCTNLEKGDILIARMPEPLGRACLYPLNNKKAATVVDVAVIRTSNANHYWLMSAINSSEFRYFIELDASGTTRTRIARGALSKIKLLAPPLPEQKKIAAILTSVDAVIEKTQAQIDKLKDLKTGMMQELLTKGIGHTEFKDSPVGRIPVEWSIKHLSDVAVIQTGIAKNRKTTGNLVELPYLRVANVQDGFLDLTEIKTIKIDKTRINRFLLKNDDVLVNEGGDFDKLGRGFIWHNQIFPCVHQNHVFVVRTDKSVLMPMFFNYLSGSEYGKKYYLGCAKQTTNLASINSSQLKLFPVLLPTINEQKKICDILGSIDNKMIALIEKLSQIKNIKKAQMQDLLTGKVRVNV